MQVDSQAESRARIAERLWAIGACATIWVLVTMATNFDGPDPYYLLVGLGALAIAVGLLTTRLSPWVVLAFVIVTGVFLRLHAQSYIDTDVARSMSEAIDGLRRLVDPYAHYFQSTNPPGSPFPYLPGAILYYVIQGAWWGGFGQYDRPAAIIVLLAIGALARIYGPGRTAFAASFYAVSTAAISRALDGSNDTALAALIAIGVVALAYAGHTRESARREKIVWYGVSALFFGWAIAFKALAWLIYPFVVRAVPREYRRLWIAGSLGFAGALSLPFFVWNPMAFVRSIAGGFGFHTNAWGFDVWSALEHLWPGIVAPLGAIPVVIEVVVVLLCAWALWRRPVRSIGEALTFGAILLAVVLGLIRWSTSTYYAFAWAIVALAIASFRPTNVHRARRTESNQRSTYLAQVQRRRIAGRIVEKRDGKRSGASH